MSNKDEILLIFDPVLCSGCMRCMIACSTYNTGVSSLTKSRIQISRHEGHALTGMDGKEELEFQAPDMVKCELCNGNPQCVRFCTAGALQVNNNEITDLPRTSPTSRKVVRLQREMIQDVIEGKQLSGPKGYAGNVGIIDLTRETANIVPFDKFCNDYNMNPRLWLGGDGFITKILWKDYHQAIDPLGPENEIIIATGVWTATAAQQSGRAMLGCISPETGGFASGSFGWFFPAVLKYAGFDIIIVRGRAVKPTYIFIDDMNISFHDASQLWGMRTGNTVSTIRQELGEHYEGEIRVMSISVGGENLVKYAPPCTDGTSAPGRSGGGAVMGSKNLKAIAVRGTGYITMNDPHGLLETSSRNVDSFFERAPNLKLWQDHGATTALSTLQSWPMTGDLLVNSRKNADFPHHKNVSCLNCHNPCYHWLQVKEGKYKDLRHLGGHMTWLTHCLRDLDITDFGQWIYFEKLTQELGIDPSSFSLAYSFLVDCFERGYLDAKDTDGITLKRGDAELIFEVARKVAYREGALGNLLADGVAEAARKIGKEAESIAPHVRGKTYLMTDVRRQALMWSLGCLTNPRGGDWMRLHNNWELSFQPESRDTYPKFLGKSNTEIYRTCVELQDMPLDLKKKIYGDPPKVDIDWIKGMKGKGLLSAWTENGVALFNSLVTCMFSFDSMFLLLAWGPTTYAEVINNITGWDTDSAEMMQVGERVFNLQRLLNYKLKGWDASGDKWADKRAYEPAPVGLYKGKEVPWDAALKDYYIARGWSSRGLPTRAKLVELKMDDLLDKFILPD